MNDGIDSLLSLMGKIGASTLHLTVGMPPAYRINGEIQPLSDMARNPDASALARHIGLLKPENISMLANQLLTSDRHRQALSEAGCTKMTRSIPGIGRFRANVYTQRGSLAVVCHALFEQVPSLDDLFPGNGIKDLLKSRSGLVLVCGPVGSGKTTLLAAMVNHVNQIEARHILVIEDPIEYLHTHQRSLVNQRQVGEDVGSYSEALEDAIDQDADVIVTGDLPDGESIIKAVVAVESGRQVLAAVPALAPDGAMLRLMDMAQDRATRVRLAGIMGGIISLDRDHTVRIVPGEEVVALLGEVHPGG